MKVRTTAHAEAERLRAWLADETNRQTVILVSRTALRSVMELAGEHGLHVFLREDWPDGRVRLGLERWPLPPLSLPGGG